MLANRARADPGRRSQPARRRRRGRSPGGRARPLSTPPDAAARRAARRGRAAPSRTARRAGSGRLILARPSDPVLESRAMTDRSAEWAARRRAWEAERAGPGARTGARATRTLLDDRRHDRSSALYGPWSSPGGGPAARHRAPGRAAVHPRHPPDRLSEPAVDDADVRRLRRRRGHERPLPAAPRRRPDRPVDRLRHADAVRLRHRRPRGGGRVRDVRRRRLEPGRHGGPARRAAARRASRPR